MYHEVLTICNTFQLWVKSNVGNREHDLHHELNGSFTNIFNKQVLEVTKFIYSQGNPFIAKPHNFVTESTVMDMVSD